MPAVGYICKNLVNLGEMDEWIDGTVPTNLPKGCPVPPPPKLVNFDRMRKTANVIKIVLSAQAVSGDGVLGRRV